MAKSTSHLSPAATPAECQSTGSARDFFPARLSLRQLREAARACHGCELHCHATQTVFGAGPKSAAAMFVGEQPGDQEDLAGKPFVGPSGHYLDEVMQDVGIDRDLVYVTNAVKHFKFEPRGKRRIHAKPSAREIAACRPWLEAEIGIIKPKVIVCLGATAVQSLLGSGFGLMKHRGEILTDQTWAPWMLATYHPSALLRMPDPQLKATARQAFRHDLQRVARQLAKLH